MASNDQFGGSHKAGCPCPICRAGRGERAPTKGKAFFSLDFRTLSLIDKLRKTYGSKGAVVDAGVKLLYEKFR